MTKSVLECVACACVAVAFSALSAVPPLHAQNVSSFGQTWFEELLGTYHGVQDRVLVCRSSLESVMTINVMEQSGYDAIFGKVDPEQEIDQTVRINPARPTCVFTGQDAMDIVGAKYLGDVPNVKGQYPLFEVQVDGSCHNVTVVVAPTVHPSANAVKYFAPSFEPDASGNIPTLYGSTANIFCAPGDPVLARSLIEADYESPKYTGEPWPLFYGVNVNDKVDLPVILKPVQASME